MLEIQAGDATSHDTITVVFEGTRVRLRQEIDNRKVSEEKFAELADVSYTWLRKILAGEPAGPNARQKIRAALSVCTVCGHKMDVPPDDVLFSSATRKRKKK